MTRAPIDGHARNGAVMLATRDYGGAGTDLLFVPGAGQTLLDCDLLAPFLIEHHRVVAMDLRGHGHSGDGPFSWTAGLDDIDAVVTDLGLHRPAVVGHSLGGILAAGYGARHPDALGLVNLDGHGALRPHQYVGVAPDLVATRLTALNALRETQLAAARQNPPTVSEATLEALVTHYRTRYPLDDTFVRQVVTRSHVRTAEGLRARTSLDTTIEIVTCVEDLDIDATYSACKAPLLVVNAVKAEPVDPTSPPWIAEHLAAYRRGLSAELAALIAQIPQLTLLEIDATHALIYEQPEHISKQITTFLAEHKSQL